MKSDATHWQPSAALDNWIPVQLKRVDSDLLCEWLFTGEKAFAEPFFDQTIAACRFATTRNRQYKVLSALEMMVQWSDDSVALPLSAVVFHVSRCGSTLLAQLLAEDERHLVLSEVPFFDELLRLPLQQPTINAASAENALCAALAFYGRQRQQNQQYLLIKTDSWHLHFYRQYRRLFPGVPFFLLYRHPLEVIRSQQKQRGLQSVPGMLEPQIFGFANDQHHPTDLDQYMAAVLESYFEKMIYICENDPLAIPLNYASGMLTLIKKVYAHLGSHLDNQLKERFVQRCRFHAKRPQQLFTGKQQQQPVPPYLERAMALYAQLEAISAAMPEVP